MKLPYVIKKSTRKNKKYMAVFTDGRPSVHFGDTRYQQYKDKTGLGLYTHLDHGDYKRRNLYYSRHGIMADQYTPKHFSHMYLW